MRYSRWRAAPLTPAPPLPQYAAVALAPHAQVLALAVYIFATWIFGEKGCNPLAHRAPTPNASPPGTYA